MKALFCCIAFSLAAWLLWYVMFVHKPDPIPPRVERAETALDENGRFRVRIEQTFSDRSAYYGERNVYVIEDTLTGCEYVGISGVGVSELGRHPVGKHTQADER